jgi:hypothetical protein
VSPEFRWEFGSRRTIGRRLPNPLDLLRRGLTKGLEVDAREPEVRRGAEVEALVTISSSRGLGDVEAGLLCTEYYDVDEDTRTGTATDMDMDMGSGTKRVTRTAIAHEAWQPLENAVGVQTVRFAIPQEAPFSYEGDCLSFKWEVVARGRRASRLDAQASREFAVLP